MISLGKLKDRKLVQWALAYLAGAWLLLQVLDLLAASFALPDVLLRIATVVLAVGFLAALVVAWYHGEKGAQRVGAVELIMLTGILIVAAAAVTFVRGPGEEPAAALLQGGGATAFTAAAAPAQVVEQGSIAVLPFVDMSAEPGQEYFSDGLTEELLNVLAQLPELRVASRTSAFAFKGKDVSIDSIARALRVANVLEGSVRRSGERVRITAQLINAGTGYHLWSESYDRELRDIFAVQDEISRAIVRALELELSGGRATGRLAKEETKDPEAHALVLKGYHFGRQNTREALEQAVELFREATRRDPAYARAYAGLAWSYSGQAYFGHGPRARLVQQARAAAERAVELDPGLAEAHSELADIAQLHDWDFRAAEAHFRRALELNPGLASPRSRMAWMLMDLGKTDEAIAEAKRATELDPVAAGLLSNLAAMYTYAGQHERAVPVYEAALALDPESPIVLANLALTYADLGRHAEAITTVERAQKLAPDEPFVLTTLAYVNGRAGRRSDAERAIRSLEALPDLSPYFLATAHAPLGDADRVFALLERAVAERDPGAPDLGVDPALDPYRADPRMRVLLDRIGLP
jgi:TolB-like protein/Flp pilus assembly protein TadD